MGKFLADEKLKEEITKYLQNKKLILKDGIKYGCDFMIYTDDPSKVHSRYGLLIFDCEMKDVKIDGEAVILAQRVLNGVGKNLIIASRGPNSYCEEGTEFVLTKVKTHIH